MLPFMIPLSHTDFAIYHDSQMAKPLNTIVSSKVLTPDKTEKIFRTLNAKTTQKKATDIQKDPSIRKVQSALESGDVSKIKDILQEIGD